MDERQNRDVILEDMDRIAEALEDDLGLVLRGLIYKVIKSFDPDDDDLQMLLMFKSKNDKMSEGLSVTSMNMDEYEATNFMYEVTDFLAMRLQDDAPPREMMN